MMDKLITFLFGVVAGTGLIVIPAEFLPEYTSSYRKGQIDALNGKSVVELKKQSDGSTKWERK
jgi:hypothetical protein